MYPAREKHQHHKFVTYRVPGQRRRGPPGYHMERGVCSVIAAAAETRRQTGERLTADRIEVFLEDLRSKGRSQESLDTYRWALLALYDFLPGSKRIGANTGERWREHLVEQGLSPRTVNARLSAFNSYCRFIGRKTWQSEAFFRDVEVVQPELSREEYLRLLQAARAAGRRKSYLIIKVLGGAGLRVQELPQLTAEAVRQGAVELASHNGARRRVLWIPPLIRRELEVFIQRENIQEGPVFRTADGAVMSRSSVYHYVNCISGEAGVPEEKATPRCLWKMYQSTCDEIENNMALLVQQAYERVLETEQLAVGWNVK